MEKISQIIQTSANNKQLNTLPNNNVPTFNQSNKLATFLDTKTAQQKTELMLKVAGYCRAPETLACLANADMQSLDISTDAIQAICNNIKGEGVLNREKKLSVLYAQFLEREKKLNAENPIEYPIEQVEYRAQQAAVTELLNSTANWISQQANLYFTINKNNEAALECARLWQVEKEYKVLDGLEIKAAFGLAAKNGKQNYNSLSVVFFCAVLKDYLQARDTVKRILSDLEGKDEKDKVLAIGQGDVGARKNAQAAENRKALFLQEVEQRKVLQTLHISKVNTLKDLKEKSLLIPENIPTVTKAITQTAHFDLLRVLLSQRTILAPKPYEAKQNKVAIAALVVLMHNKQFIVDETIDEVLILLDNKPLAYFCQTIEKHNEFVAAANENVKAKLKNNSVDLWYQYAVETCDLQQLILLGF
jgi:hypothetical protein